MTNAKIKESVPIPEPLSNVRILNLLLLIYRPMWLDFFLITFFLHFSLSWTNSLPISSSAISPSTLSALVFYLQLLLLESVCIKMHIFSPCCCLPTPMTLAIGGSPIFLLVVHSQLLRPTVQQCTHSGGVWPQIQG